MDNFGITDLEMEKQRLLDTDIESLQFVCVDPRIVNPVTQLNTAPQQLATEVQQFKVDCSTPPLKFSAISGGEFYVPHEKKIKLEMEEFSDLSLFLPSKTQTKNSVDELSTPIYDKALPGYDLNINNTQPVQLTVKVERDKYRNNSILNAIKKLYDHSNDFTNINYVPNSRVLPGSEYEQTSDHPGTQNYVCDFNYSLEPVQAAIPSVGTSEIVYSNASSPSSMDFQRVSSGMTTPEQSVCSSAPTTPKLSLNVNLKPAENKELATSTIIEDVVDLETDHFNIFEYFNNELNEPCNTVSIEDILEPVQVTSLHCGSDKYVSKPELYLAAAKKRSRKKRSPDDDDEDYVPPSEKSKKFLKQYENLTDSDSESELDTKVKIKTKPRGRPPKRTDSISSDCSKEGDASKYRELRDKNNEASRRSRLKRKLKEQELEGEADDLYSHNIKLKAQVEELEKLVTKFREDLFKIMIRK